MQSKSEVEQENWLLQHNGQTPRMPEPYRKLLELRRLRINTFSGGLYNQPHYQKLEFNACLDAEAEIKQINEANLKIQLAGQNA